MTEETKCDQICNGASVLLMDLLAQIVNLVVAVEKEARSIEKDQLEPLERGSRGSPISVRALKTSIVFLQFSVLEALANILAELITVSHQGTDAIPKATNPLSQTELDSLKEQRSYLDFRTGEVKTKQAVYIPILDKLSIAPALLARSYGQNFRVNKGDVGWGRVRKLKQLRNSLTHIRLDLPPQGSATTVELNLDNVRPSVMVSSQNLFSGSEAIIWYSRQIRQVFTQIAVPEYERMVHLMMFVEAFAYMHLLNLRESCGVSEERLNEMYPIFRQQPTGQSAGAR